MPMLKYFSAYILIASLFVSCKKSDTFDITGDPIIKFYTNNTSLGNAPQNSISYSVVNIPNTAGSGIVNLSTTMPSEIKFAVLASRPVSQDVTIGAVLDNSLIDAYNTANNTNYKPFPAGLLKTENLVARIKAGTTTSTDSVTIATDLTALASLTDVAYMAPIKLTTVSDRAAGEITGNTQTQVTYIVANVEQRRIKYNALAAEALGALITPRTAWTVLFNPSPTSVGGTGSITDGSLTSYSRFGTSPVQVDVNMQAARNVTGIRLYTTNSATLIPTQVEVYLSNDGINYDLIGAPLRANLTYASSYNYILFYKAIPAQYIRLKLYYTTSTNTQNTRITELDVYAN